MGDKIIVREAVRNDCIEIYRLIRELADFEKLRDQLTLTPEKLAEDGFGPDSFYRCIVAETKDTNEEGTGSPECHLIGYALYYFTYSTFQGRSIYLEDIYTIPSKRGLGVGSAMLKKLAQVGLEKQCVRLDFVVLNWNTESIDFYARKGAKDITILEKWHLQRIEKEDLQKLAE